MSTATSIYFSHIHYDIKYAQIQNISTTAAVLTRFVVAITYWYSRVQINRKVANPIQNIPGYDTLLLYTMSAARKIILKQVCQGWKKWYAVYVKISILIVERKGLLYMLKLVCYW